MKACALRGENGKSVATPTGGLFRISSIIASKSGPGSLKTSPGSRFGVITESSPAFEKVASSGQKRIGFHYLKPEDYGLGRARQTDWASFPDFEEAYYTFIHELTDIQVASLQLVLDGAPVQRIFVDGGFNANSIFLEMLRIKLPDHEIIPSDFPNGSALGAAMLVNKKS